MKKGRLAAGLLALSVMSVCADAVVINLGDSRVRSDLDGTTLGAGINANDYTALKERANTALTMAYDITSYNIGAAATLELALVGSAALHDGASYGLAVVGGSNNLWLDVGETVSFTLKIKDSEGIDITSDLDYVGLTGFSVRGRNSNNDGLGTVVQTTVAGQSRNLNPTDHGTAGYYVKPIAEGVVDLSTLNYQFDASRSGQDDILELGQLQFELIPEPATLGLVAAFGGGILFIRRRFMM